MSIRTVSALMGAAFAAVCTLAPSAHATVKPISGIPVGLEGDPESIVVARGTTDDKGNFTFKGLAPGRYVLVIDGPGLVAAMDKVAPREPEKEESHSSFSLGIGGFMGGGSSRASGQDGAGPENGGSSQRSSSGGGFGLSIPLGGGDGKDAEPSKKKDYDWDEAVGDSKVYISWGIGDGSGDARSGNSLALPYCAAAPGDVRIGFTIPKGSLGNSEAGHDAVTGRIGGEF